MASGKAGAARGIVAADEDAAPGAEAVAAPRHSAPVPPDPNERYDFPLPSGGVAQILRRKKGRHIRLAARLVPANEYNPTSIGMAMISVMCLINGKAVTFEDVDELEAMDVWPLVGQVMGGKGVTSPLATLPH